MQIVELHWNQKSNVKKSNEFKFHGYYNNKIESLNQKTSLKSF